MGGGSWAGQGDVRGGMGGSWAAGARRNDVSRGPQPCGANWRGACLGGGPTWAFWAIAGRQHDVIEYTGASRAIVGRGMGDVIQYAVVCGAVVGCGTRDVSGYTRCSWEVVGARRDDVGRNAGLRRVVDQGNGDVKRWTELPQGVYRGSNDVRWEPRAVRAPE